MRSGSELEKLRSPRLVAAIDAAAASGDARTFLVTANAVLSGASPQSSLSIARAVGTEIALRRGKVEVLCRALANDEASFWARAFAAFAYAARGRAGLDVRGADEALQSLADSSEAAVREAVIAALRSRTEGDAAATVSGLASWTDGYLQANVALEVLANKDLLSQLADAGADELVLRLDEAWRLADLAPRSADRSQGLRTLRGELPGQVTLFAGRFPRAVFPWLEGKLGAKRPETRAVVEAILSALKRASLPHAEFDRLRAALEATAKPPRDPSRIVHGTRRRSR